MRRTRNQAIARSPDNLCSITLLYMTPNTTRRMTAFCVLAISTSLRNTILYYAVLHYPTQRYMLNYTSLGYATLRNTLNYITLSYTTLRYTRTIPHYAILRYAKL